FGGNCCAAAKGNSLRSRRCGAHGIRDQLDMRRSSTAAATNKLRARLYEALRKLRHVFRRTHVKLPPLHVARQARVWLRRQFLLRDFAHFLERAQNDRWSNAAVEPDNVGAPAIESLGEQFRRGAK